MESRLVNYTSDEFFKPLFDPSEGLFRGETVAEIITISLKDMVGAIIQFGVLCAMD